MKALKYVLGMTLPLALMACGGGGGGDAPADKPQQQNEQPKPNNSNENYAGLSAQEREAIRNFSEAMQPISSNNVTGALVATKASNLAIGNFSPSAVQPLSGVSYEFVIPENNVPSITIPRRTSEAQTVGDIKIYKNYQEFRNLSQGASNPSYKHFMVSDSGYASSQFGVTATNDADSELRAFYRGNTTPVAAMPTSGTFTYQGQLILIPELAQSRENYLGTVAANVDFASKRIAFAVAAENYSSAVNAEIIGSAFAGKNGSKSIDGIFTGNTAGEMTGGYYDVPAGVVGVFGAKRQ